MREQNGTSESKQMLEGGLWLLLGIVVIVLLAIFVAWSFLELPAEDARIGSCGNDLGFLGKAIMSYANAYGGYFPVSEQGERFSLALLYPRYVDDAADFACPGADTSASGSPVFPAGTKLAGKPLSYRYVPGYRYARLGEREDPPDTPIAWDLPGNHDRRGINVLYFDGHVKWLDGRLDPHK